MLGLLRRFENSCNGKASAGGLRQTIKSAAGNIAANRWSTGSTFFRSCSFFSWPSSDEQSGLDISEPEAKLLPVINLTIDERSIMASKNFTIRSVDFFLDPQLKDRAILFRACQYMGEIAKITAGICNRGSR